ncbi:amino acid adenylation domain-containing protein [Xenorhabdus bovienii]|uniref:Amino acid adenylation domain-containing protein n=1 Tax=Xenorhabdus bovienii TaxID=40576 RepID=A0AAJ1J3N0_XENBV|nr:non-ribosomal peptide synthetase [Xenorhabdus bovienii]MDE1476894.1 amino acid adenylation domain-containing protein [Xenorhabdus bovienii]MDE1494186.1 amino acid adenylation domain-containing protein [Xenorhabdus bovienii]MDE9444916.1 amino acid adenylation domain-containing protein [Xenorhabdus bovienii]MDE9472588.1 amino acid adenylation domain-containing protein [Xenorhabdus bovienii]MDE9475954.1 amino acid adenylation domain-containing protein [Xenorhabdus bovienii]
MDVRTVMLSLLEKGISVYISKGNLAYKSLSGVLDTTTFELLKKYKLDFLVYFKSVWKRVEKKECTFPSEGSFEMAPLSPSQERLWVSEKMGSEHQFGQYNITGACYLKGNVNVRAIEWAINTIIQRHQVLRTVILHDEILGVMQIVREEFYFSLEQQDFNKREKDIDQEINNFIDKEGILHFDLSQDLMLRVNLLNLTENEHVLVFTMHHIASDGWSMNILINEFSSLYNAFIHDYESQLPPLTLQYTDYSRWLYYTSSESLLKKHQVYWKTYLYDIPSIHNLPLDFPRPSKQTFKGAAINTLIEKDIFSRFDKMCRIKGATLFMGLNAVFSVLLSRYSGEKDIVVGTPIANRNRDELENIIGFFINTVVLRTDLSDNPNFEQLLERNKEFISDSFSNTLSFEQLLEIIKVDRSLSYNPIFQIMIVLQNNEQSKISLEGIDIEFMEVTQQSSKFDLTLNIVPNEKGLLLNWKYNTTIFSQTSISRMAEHFTSLVNNVLETPKVPVLNLSFLSKIEQSYLLEYLSNPHKLKFTVNKYLYDFIKEQSKLRPEAIALVYGSQRLSYRELEQLTNNIAYELSFKGIQVGDIICICAEKSFESIAAMLAVWKCGAIYLPISPKTPPNRADFILNDATARTILFDQEGAQLVGTLQKNITKITLAELMNNQNVKVPSFQFDEKTDVERIAYLIYTSGSTGQPKGVLVRHTNAVSVLSSVAVQFDIGPNTIMPAIASLAFDISFFEIVMPLMRGGMVKLYTHREVTNIPSLVNDMNSWTHLHAVPSLMNAILDECERLNVKSDNLRQIYVGGDRVSSQLLKRLKESFEGKEIIELYGPTEGTILSTAYRITNEKPEKLKGSVIGCALPHAKVYVLDEINNIAPIGVVGELCIGGEGVAFGYLNRADETKQRFIDNPFTVGDRERLYRTGDLVRWLPNGNLEFIGRNDYQVKIRGFRIELSEIEAALCKRKDVEQAVVLLQEKNDNPYLVAYIIGKMALEPSVLKTYLSNQLPDYMVPSVYHVLDSFPLTPNGKLNKSRLPLLHINKPSVEYTAPRSQLETNLCQIWEIILGLDKVGIHDDFFSIGGNSLAAIKVNALCQQQLDLDIPLDFIFRNKTIANISILLEEKSKQIIPSLKHKRYPLSFTQEHMLLIELLEEGSHAYHIPYFARLDKNANVSMLIKALNKIADRHSILKSIFSLENKNHYEQIILIDNIQIKNTVLETESEVQAEVEKCIYTPFKLNCEPGMRLRTWSTDTNNYMLILFHHIVFDGWSEKIFMSELSHIYQSLMEDKEISLPEPMISYGDYAQWQRMNISNNKLKEQYNYWKEHLSNFEYLALPLDFPRPSFPEHKGDVYAVDFTSKFSQDLKKVAREEKTTLYSVLLTASFLTLSSVCNQKDVIIGTYSDNRNNLQTQSIIGLFANSLALRCKINPKITLAALIVEVHQLIGQAKSHQELPFRKVMEMLGIELDASIHPVYQVMFNLTTKPEWQTQLPIDLETGLQRVVAQNSPPKHDLALEFCDEGEHIHGGFLFDISVLKKSTVVSIAERFQNILYFFINKRNKSIQSILETFVEEHNI